MAGMCVPEFDETTALFVLSYQDQLEARLAPAEEAHVLRDKLSQLLSSPYQ